jgi:hypothetical protein
VSELLVGIALAALSGITFLAYKHPKAYGQLFVALILTLVGIEIGTLAWDSSISKAHKIALSYIVPEKLDEASKAITDEEILSSAPYVYYGIVALAAYFVFLRYLFPFLLNEDKAVPKESDKQ